MLFILFRDDSVQVFFDYRIFPLAVLRSVCRTVGGFLLQAL